MNINKEKIKEISNEITEKLGFFIVDFSFRGDQRKPIIEVFVDSSENVTADNLAEISREINSAVEENGLIDKSYRLDVSSPGVDRPLKFLKQFPKHINRDFEITYKLDEETYNITGKLLLIEKEDLTFFSGGKNIIINFNNITIAKVIISFS